MGYRDIYKESNEQAEERFSLVMERIAEIAEETDVPEKFDDYFKKTAAFLLQLKNVSEKAEKDTLKDASLTECEKQNAGFYDDIKAENYGKSYGNPTYAVEKLGEEYGQILSALYAECRKRITDVYAAKKMNVTITAELFVEIYNYFEDKEGIDKTAIEQAVYWYFHDYSEIFIEDSVRELVDSEEDFLYQIVMNSDLNDLRYLYQYGQHIGKNETGIAAFLNGMSDEEIQAMADTYTEGYRIGFAATGKDLSKKTRTQVTGKYLDIKGDYQPLTGVEFTGYEIHMGESTWKSGARASTWTKDGVTGQEKTEGTVFENVCGTYVHGIFDKEESALALIRAAGKKKGIDVSQMEGVDFAAFKETQYDILAAELRKHLDMKKIYEILEEGTGGTEA